jgi:hypothetical protein
MIRGEVFVRYRYNELSLRQVAEGYSSNSTNLIIACIDKAVVRNFFRDWKWINIGLVVSEALYKLPKEQRKKMVVDIVRNAIEKVHEDNIVLENIDILFFPEYSLDVVKTLQMVGKNKRLLVIWDGHCKNGVLTYSKPDYPDFHKYKIKDYGVYCITK